MWATHINNQKHVPAYNFFSKQNVWSCYKTEIVGMPIHTGSSLKRIIGTPMTEADEEDARVHRWRWSSWKSPMQTKIHLASKLELVFNATHCLPKKTKACGGPSNYRTPARAPCSSGPSQGPWWSGATSSEGEAGEDGAAVRLLAVVLPDREVVDTGSRPSPPAASSAAETREAGRQATTRRLARGVWIGHARLDRADGFSADIL